MIDNPYQQIIELLDRHKITYRVLTHNPVYTSAEADAARPADVTISQGAKALLLKTDGEFKLFVLPGDRKLNMQKVRKVMEVNRIRFATKEEVVKVMGCEVGACYPIGNVCEITTYVDNTLSENHQIAFNAGEHTKSIIMKYSDYIAVTDPKLCDIVTNEKIT